MKSSVVLPSKAWSDQSTSNTTIRLCKISEQPCSSQQPLLVSHCITIASDLTWEAFAYGYKLDPCQCQPLHGITPHLNNASLQHLLHVLDTSTICAGHPDEKYVSMLKAKKGKRVIASDGCTRVMQRRNIDTKRGLVNGAYGTVLSIAPNHVTVQFDHVSEPYDARMVKSRFMVMENFFVYRKQFPLILAYAVTIHKCRRSIIYAASDASQCIHKTALYTWKRIICLHLALLSHSEYPGIRKLDNC